MTNPAEIVPGVIFYSYHSAVRKDKVGFLGNHKLVLQVSGHFALETSAQTISMNKGEMLLIGKNQLGQITKTPMPNENYETIVISLQENILRKIALDEKIEIGRKYAGPSNVLIPANEFLRTYFQSVVPYISSAPNTLTQEIGILKVKEAVKLLLHTMPGLRDLLFDFSEPHKIDLEKFMLSHFHYNIPIHEFAGLTGRSLATFKRDFQKTFRMAPRQWLQERRLTEARNLIENRNKKPTDIYLDLGFESLSHFSNSFKKKFGKTPTQIVTQRLYTSN
jgi:AraC family transcriptional regulator, exoenzyme S synthesis regulatory protein ExsA